MVPRPSAGARRNLRCAATGGGERGASRRTGRASALTRPLAGVSRTGRRRSSFPGAPQPLPPASTRSDAARLGSVRFTAAAAAASAQVSRGRVHCHHIQDAKKKKIIKNHKKSQKMASKTLAILVSGSKAVRRRGASARPPPPQKRTV